MSFNLMSFIQKKRLISLGFNAPKGQTMQTNIHPPLFGTVIYGKDGTTWVKRWPLGRSFLMLEVDFSTHKTWGRFNKQSQTSRNRLYFKKHLKHQRWF